MAGSSESALIGQRARLVGGADHDEVGRHVVVEERLGHGLRVEVDVGVLARDPVDAHERAAQLGELERRVHHHAAGGNLARRDHRDGAPRLGLVEVDRIRRHEEIEAQVEIGAAGRDLVGDLDGPRVDAQVGHDGPALLGQPRLVEPAHVAAVQHGRRAQDLVDRDDAGAADAHHVQGEAVARHAQHRLGQLGLERRQALLALRRLPDGLDGEEGRAVTEQARVVLVARGLVNLRLPAELGLDRLDGEAVRLLAAVAAPLADRLVDEDARLGIRLLAALAQPSLLGRALLIVDERGDAGHRRQHRLGLKEPVAVPDLAVVGDRHALVVLGVIRGDDDALDPVGFEAPVRAGMGKAPAASWPPVIATAEL